MNQLLKSKIPLAEGLKVCKEQVPSLKNTIQDLSYQIEHGALLSEALQKHSRFFDSIFVHYIRLGEQTGKNYFESIHRYLVFKQSISQGIKRALIYPAFITVFLIILMWTLHQFLLPELLMFLKEQNKAMSFSTKTLMAFLRHGPYVMTLSAVFIIMLFRSSQFVLKIPYIGSLLFNYYMALYFKSVSLFLKEKVPLSQALLWAAEGIKNTYLKNDLLVKIEHFQQGARLFEILPVDQNFLKMAEDHGFLGEGLETLSTLKMQHIEDQVEVMLKIIEPLIIVILGGVILLVVLAIWSPLYAMAV